MKISRTTVLPVKLKNELDGLELTGIQRQHAYRLCDLIINKQSRDEHDYSSYVELPQEYLRKLFGGGNYHRFFDKLKSQIIQVDGWVKATGEFVESYTNSDGEGQSKRYRIQPDLLAYSFTPATYQTKDFEGSNGQIKLACGHFSKEVVLCDIGKLKINKEKLLHVMEEHIKTIQKDNFEIDRQIKDTAFDIHDWLSGYEGFTKLELCLQRAQRNSVNVIKDKRKFILADVDKYIAQKQKNIRLNYTRSIEMLCNSACHYADRNTANDRLDHNLTSISKVLLPVIKAENNLVEVERQKFYAHVRF